LAWEILNVFAVYWMGFWWVLYPFPCNVLAVYPLGTLALAPSVYLSELSKIFFLVFSKKISSCTTG